MLLTILLIVLILMAIGSFPVWPHSAGWGPFPGIILVIVVVLLVVLLAGEHRLVW
jgi:hypothetical protein